jgi:hypothetical protein
MCGNCDVFLSEQPNEAKLNARYSEIKENERNRFGFLNQVVRERQTIAIFGITTRSGEIYGDRTLGSIA